MISVKYHDATKHDFNRFARSLGYLDWASQPDPFRRFAGAPAVELRRTVLADGVSYAALYGQRTEPASIDQSSVGEFLRCSMGLSAWKEYRGSRWALRVNPSSGNLHPTETYLVWDGAVHHYAPGAHVLERRCAFDRDRWREFSADSRGFLVALTTIHWREAWKYGERAFRYCQHDAGHAIAALRYAAALLGWKLTLLPRWSDEHLAQALGLDRASDFQQAERETPECIAVVTPDDPLPWTESDPAILTAATGRGEWSGVANRLSRDRVEWPIIEEVAEATGYPGVNDAAGERPLHATTSAGPEGPVLQALARDVILRRRSALALDGESALRASNFISMLRRLLPGSPPWDAIDWPPQVHLILFVHRVDGLAPGIYAYLRDPNVLAEWRTAMRPEFLWERIHAGDDLFLLVPLDVRLAANRLSCDQDIAADGFFSLGMLARFEASLRGRGEWFYRRLFWECGMIGQVLYLEAEAIGTRGTGIGCFYDDPVHDTLGLSGHAWQSLYHFSMGVPVEDARLTTEPGYEWENQIGDVLGDKSTVRHSPREPQLVGDPSLSLLS